MYILLLSAVLALTHCNSQKTAHSLSSMIKSASTNATKNETEVDPNSFAYIMGEYQGRPFDETGLYERFLQGTMVRSDNNGIEKLLDIP